MFGFIANVGEKHLGDSNKQGQEFGPDNVLAFLPTLNSLVFHRYNLLPVYSV
jgi:hypothetical protein